MKTLTDKLRKHFGVNQSEASGMLVMIVLCFIFLTSTMMVRFTSSSEGMTPVNMNEAYALDSLLNSLHTQEEEIQKSIEKGCEGNFKIDPNNATPEELSCLELPEFIIQRIIKFRNKGGVFYEITDLKKIYGLEITHYEKIKHHIVIQKVRGTSYQRKTNTTPNTQKTEPSFIFDINTADTNDLKKVKGIGSVLSNRIIKFRNQLGGFHSIEQLNEVYGLKGEALTNLKQRITISINCELIDINSVDITTLAAHPYISYDLARSIIGVREKFGDYHSPQEIMDKGLIKRHKFEKLKHYLVIKR